MFNRIGFIKDLGLPDYNFNPGNTKSLIGVVIYTNNKIKPEVIIDKENVSGILLYYKENQLIETELYIKANKTLKYNADFSTRASNIIANDINYISDLFFRNELDRNSIAIINFNNIPPNINYESTFQLQINKRRNELFSTSSKSLEQVDLIGTDSCLKPCRPGEKTFCTAQESLLGGETWTCFPRPKDCVHELLRAKVIEFVLESLYPDNSISLRNFRDNFLLLFAKGRKYIDNYYRTPSKFVNDMSQSYVNNSMTIIRDEILPIINKIMTLPTSSSVLFNTNSADRIISFCNLSKSILTDSESQTIINEIINDINNFVNKPISQVISEFNL